MPVPTLLKTPLHELHRELGARLVEFAGYEMPVSYPEGIIAEHRQCRSAAALFDVSHMGQISVAGEAAARALETLVPMDVCGLVPGQQRYAFFTNSSAGILDDLMITRRDSDFLLIVNAACKTADLQHLTTHIGHRCTVRALPGRALLALQGPAAVTVLGRIDAQLTQLGFMEGTAAVLHGVDCYVTRSGYTGEDGFELSMDVEHAEALARALLAAPEVKPAGLGARDTLRLEAGLCLYGHDIDATTTPIEAGLGWAVQKIRRPGGARAGGFPGANVYAGQLSAGVASKRVGLIGLERIPVREGAVLIDAHGKRLGRVTSGTLSPSLNRPIAMAYVATNHAMLQHEVYAEVRGSRQPLRVTTMPFVAHRYART